MRILSKVMMLLNVLLIFPFSLACCKGSSYRLPGELDRNLSHEATTIDYAKSLNKKSGPALQDRAHSKRSTEAFLACVDLSVKDDGNNNAYRDPNIRAHWHDAPEWYVWIRAKCQNAHYSPDIDVTCKKIRSRGLEVTDGVEIVHRTRCPPEKVCTSKSTDMNGNFAVGTWEDILCVDRKHSLAHRIATTASSQSWCSLSILLNLQASAFRASYQLSLEVATHGKSLGSYLPTQLWFEITSTWSKTHSKFAVVTGKSETTGVVNTAPALGKTFVRFCATIPAKRAHGVPLYVDVEYAYSLRPPRPPPGTPYLDMADIS